MTRSRLSDEDRALWVGFTRSITPLRPSAGGAAKVPKQRSAPPTAKAAPPAVLPVAPRQPAGSREALSPAPLGRRLKQRVARGRDPIDARLDLHGMTQTEAHSALIGFLHRAQAQGASTVLIVTGKGSGRAPDKSGPYSAEDAPRGVLKRQVPMWLRLPEFRPLIVAFGDAHVGHGGQGALYVRLRRPK